MCQHNKQFDEWWGKQVENSDGSWTTLERLAAKDAWEAATKMVVEKFISTNTGSPKLPPFKVCLSAFFTEPCCESDPRDSRLLSRFYDCIRRQLQAGA
jgi:hypothetical protein